MNRVDNYYSFELTSNLRGDSYLMPRHCSFLLSTCTRWWFLFFSAADSLTSEGVCLVAAGRAVTSGIRLSGPTMNWRRRSSLVLPLPIGDAIYRTQPINPSDSIHQSIPASSSIHPSLILNPFGPHPPSIWASFSIRLGLIRD